MSKRDGPDKAKRVKRNLAKFNEEKVPYKSPDHIWIKASFLWWWTCLHCGVVRRADGGNGPCKGRVRVETREDE